MLGKFKTTKSKNLQCNVRTQSDFHAMPRDLLNVEREKVKGLHYYIEWIKTVHSFYYFRSKTAKRMKFQTLRLPTKLYKA